jgi:hypothetical protein
VAICAYRFRAYPTTRQRRRLAREFGAARWAYNRGLETISRAWRERQERMTGVDFSRQLTKLKQAEVPWLKEVSSYVLTQSLRDLDRALRLFMPSGPATHASRNGAASRPSATSSTGDSRMRTLRGRSWSCPSSGP